MTSITLYGGPLKSDLIRDAYEACGQSEFELTAEELDAGCRLLNDVMGELQDIRGISVGYNFPPTGNGSSDEESGIPRGAVKAIRYQLAQALAPTIGKTLPPEAQAPLAASFALLVSNYSTVPLMQMGRNTPRGAGNSRLLRRTPYFITDISADEVQQ